MRPPRPPKRKETLPAAIIDQQPPAENLPLSPPDTKIEKIDLIIAAVLIKSRL
jgi:hypothetical protein